MTGGAAVETYFRAFSTGQPSGMQDMIKSSAKRSPARTYARVQIATAAAQRAEIGSGLPPQTFEIIGGDIELCAEPIGEIAEGQECFRFADFETTNGQLASFTAGGESIDDRLVRGGQTVEVGGTAVTLVGAYHSAQSGNLAVAFEAEPGSQSIEIEWYGASYVDPDGATVASSAAFGPTELRSGRQNIGVVYFDHTPVGGTVELTAYDADYNDITLEFDL